MIPSWNPSWKTSKVFLSSKANYPDTYSQGRNTEHFPSTEEKRRNTEASLHKTEGLSS